jgi:phthalate 4,5-cis-dihydrodiol dehydrogenase
VTQPDHAHKERLRIGIVGLGMAGGLMVPIIAQHPRMQLAGAAELSPVLRARFAAANQVEAHADAAELLNRSDIDGVYIATPHQFHREHAVMAAERGKHVMVEKPMALTLDDCDAMIDAAARHRRVLIVGHTHSFDPAVRIMREIVASGELGRLAMITMFNYTDFMYRPRRPEELDTALGGGILFNQIPHQVDVARFLSPSPLRSVRAMTGILDPRRPTEGCCTAFLEFMDGSAATITYSGYDHFDSDELHSWVGSTGQVKTPNHGATRRAWLALGGGSEELQLRQERYGYGANSRFKAGGAPHQPHFGIMVASCARGDMRPTPSGVGIYDDAGVREISIAAGRDGRTALLDEFCDAIIGGISPLHDGQFARGTLAACLAILQSARERREVML